MARHMLLVQSEPLSGQDADYNDWYNNTHLPDILTIPGFVAAQRFKVEGQPIAGAIPDHRYIAIYEIETDDIDAVIQTLGEMAPTFHTSPAMDMSVMTAAYYEAISPRLTSG